MQRRRPQVWKAWSQRAATLMPPTLWRSMVQKLVMARRVQVHSRRPSQQPQPRLPPPMAPWQQLPGSLLRIPHHR